MNEQKKIIQLKEAMKAYDEQRIAKLVEVMLDKFENDGVKLDDPEGYTHEQVVYRNLIYGFYFKAPNQGDEMNYILYGIAIKEAMDNNPKFDEFIRGYIKLALEADKKAWVAKNEVYNRWVDEDEKRAGGFYKNCAPKNKPNFLLDPNDPRYNQGKAMAYYILNEM